MEESYRELFGILGKVREILDKLSDLQGRKARGAARGDLMEVNECMKQEQVLSLSLRSLDQKREKLTALLGIAGQPVSKLPFQVPEALRPEALSCADRLLQSFRLYKTAAQLSRNTLEIALREVDLMLAASGVKEDSASIPESVTDFRA